MGAYTWTFVRIDKLTSKMLEDCVTEVKHKAKHTTYGSYYNKSWGDALNDWLKFHEEEYDYFVNECGVDPKKMTKEYLTKKLKHKMKLHRLKLECYDKCLNGEMTIEEVLRKTHQLQCTLGDFYVIKRKGHYYIQIDHEVFRNYEYCDKEFHTVDALIEHCRKSKKKNFIDYKNGYDYQEWNDTIEKNVREYYEAIGDDNFYVHFG